MSVKLPTFKKDKPLTWIAETEAQFSLGNVTQEATKYTYVVFQLEELFINKVEDIMTVKSAQNPYKNLKSEHTLSALQYQKNNK